MFDALFFAKKCFDKFYYCANIFYMKKTGSLITFEGGEGCGKSTLIKNIKEYFEQHNVEYIATFEPGGLELCNEIRSILKYSKHKIGKRAELLLFSASRAELCDEVIAPNLDAGKIVLCDRFFDSTRVYQGYANGIADSDIMAVTNIATNGIVPDITFFLDIDPKVAFERKGGKDAGDRIEARDLKYHQMVREGFLNLATKEKRFVVLDATKSPQQLVDDVIAKLKGENIIE